MATRNIVPRANGEGSIGTSSKAWGGIFTGKVNGYDLTSTPTASAIPRADENGKLDVWVRNGGECYLTLSGSNLLLSRCYGRRLIIDDAVQIIPEAGVTLASTGVANTTYYIYAPIVSGAMILEASITAYTPDDRNGFMVKSGDVTRALVGMARTDANGAWVDSAKQRFVLSYYNRNYLMLDAQYAVSGEISSADATNPIMISAAKQLEFLSWGAEGLLVSFFVNVKVNATPGAFARIYMDGLNVAHLPVYTPTVNAYISNAATFGVFVSDAGYHYLDARGLAWTGTVATWDAYWTTITGGIWG